MGVRGRQKNSCKFYSKSILLAGVVLVSVGFVGRVCGQAEKEFGGRVRLILPEVIYAVVGVEANVYFDNVCLTINPANYAFDVSCDKGRQMVERWSYTPKAQDVNDYRFTLEVRDDDNNIVARANSIVRVVAADAGAGVDKSILIIGDSLTGWSVYPQQVLDRCEGKGNPKIRLVGSHVPEYTEVGEFVRHEGYAGWRAKHFITKYNGVARTGLMRSRGCGSPFIYEDDEGKTGLDFARYCREYNGGDGPDIVTIFLGCNDVFGATDKNLEKSIDTMFGYYDSLLEMIHSVDKDTKIGCVMPVPPAGSQDAFGMNYKCGQTRWQYKRNQHRLVERMEERYGGRENENIYLVAAHINLDTINNYPKVSVPVNSHNDLKTVRLNNSVHPAKEGYFQIGDSIYCWLKGQMALEDSE